MVLVFSIFIWVWVWFWAIFLPFHISSLEALPSTPFTQLPAAANQLKPLYPPSTHTDILLSIYSMYVCCIIFVYKCSFAFCLIYRRGNAIAELSASIQFRRFMAAYYSILTLKINGLADLKTIIYFREVLLQLLQTRIIKFKQFFEAKFFYNYRLSVRPYQITHIVHFLACLNCPVNFKLDMRIPVSVR